MSNRLVIRSCPHHHTDIFIFFFQHFRLLAVGRASRLRLRAGDAPNSSGTRGDFLHQDVPRDGNSGEDVVRDVVELGTIFIVGFALALYIVLAGIR